MATIQIKHVPEQARDYLHRCSDRSHQSLQEFMLTRLEGSAAADQPDAFDQLDAQATATIDYDLLTELIRADRNSH